MAQTQLSRFEETFGLDSLEALADKLARTAPDSWDARYERNKYSTDNPEQVVVERRGLWDSSEQSYIPKFGLPVSGVRLTVRHDRGSLYNVTFRSICNGVNARSSRLVITSSFMEMYEWVERAVEAVDQTPEGWRVLPGESLSMLQWVPPEGNCLFWFYQEDRDCGERREYSIVREDNPKGRGMDSKRLQDDLVTAVLFEPVIETVEEHDE